MRMRKVDTTKPIVPVVRSASRIEMAELMTVLPNRSVHNSRLPCFRTAHIDAFRHMIKGLPPKLDPAPNLQARGFNDAYSVLTST